MNNLDCGVKYRFEITDLNQHGQGIGRVNNLVVFVDGTVPGDYIEAELLSLHGSYGIAGLLCVLTPSPDRIVAPCQVFECCGGCSLQTMRYEAQLVWKRRKMVAQLQRIGKVENAELITEATAGMTEPWHYRGKVQMPVGGTFQNPEIGFYRRRSHQIADADECLIQHRAADLVRRTVRDFIIEFRIEPYNEQSQSGLLRHVAVRIGFNTGQVMVILVINGRSLPAADVLAERLRVSIAECGFDLAGVFLNINTRRGNVVMGAENRLVFGQPYIEEKLLGVIYRISPGAFFQVNPLQTELLYGIVLEMADLRGNETVLDLYCGTGSISLLLAKKSARVIGVEIVRQAIEDAENNARINECSNVSFIAAAAEKWLPEYISGNGCADLLVLDPPRKGCDAELLGAVLAVDVPRIIYVSCNPATLARDLLALSVKYEVKRVVPVDMFPHSDSIECSALLTLRG